MFGVLVGAQKTMSNEQKASPCRMVRMTRKEALVCFVVRRNELAGRSVVAVRLLERDNVGVEH